jgi:hypothetical protein
VKLQKGHPGKNYKSVWDKISVLDNAILVINATQIVVPMKLCHQILKQFHEPKNVQISNYTEKCILIVLFRDNHVIAHFLFCLRPTAKLSAEGLESSF